MKHIPDIRALLRHINNASDFMRWLHAEGDSLVASAELLGGREWAARACTVVEAAKAGNDLAARRGELHELHRLLRLDFTTDIKSVEGKRFAAVHPDDPRADIARRCAEALCRGVHVRKSEEFEMEADIDKCRLLRTALATGEVCTCCLLVIK